MPVSFRYWRIRDEKLPVGFQETSLTFRKAEVAHLDCVSRSDIRKGLKEDERV
jgi:hypothetical protein